MTSEPKNLLKNPHILEFDIDEKDRGFTQNMVGGQIVIPNLYLETCFEILQMKMQSLTKSKK